LDEGKECKNQKKIEDVNAALESNKKRLEKGKRNTERKN